MRRESATDRAQGPVATLAAHPLWLRLTATALSKRFMMYALGSIVAFVIGNVVFVGFYLGGASTTTCSIAGFIGAAIPNWLLNRRWAWQREGRPPARQVIGYVAVSIAVLATTSAVTGWANAHAHSLTSGFLRLVIVAGSYIVVTIALFFAKFVIYEYWVFSDRSRIRAALRSLRQVPSTADANRNP